MSLFGGTPGSSRPSNASNPTGGQRTGVGGMVDRAQAGLRSVANSVSNVGNAMRNAPGANGQGSNHFGPATSNLNRNNSSAYPVSNLGGLGGARAPVAAAPQAGLAMPVMDPQTAAYFASRPAAGLPQQPHQGGLGAPPQMGGDLEAAEAWKARYGSYPRWFKQ